MTLLTGWELDPFAIIALAAVTWAYVSGARAVNRRHPNAPFPKKRVTWFLLGMATMAIALLSPVATYDTTLFSVHMVQHMLIMMVAAPLLLLGTPIILILRLSSTRIRREVIFPILHSLPLKALAFPPVAWVIFAGTMWISHFSPIFNESLENIWLHRLEHFWYITAALIFWWPAIGHDPAPWKMNHPVRMLYVFVQMPQNSFLGNAIYTSNSPLYNHYETLTRDWGPSALGDQQMAGIIMWVIGDMMFLAALAFICYGWVKYEERSTRRQDRALERERALARAPLEPPTPEAGHGAKI
jgi:putative copper resistance protein D